MTDKHWESPICPKTPFVPDWRHWTGGTVAAAGIVALLLMAGSGFRPGEGQGDQGGGSKAVTIALGPAGGAPGPETPEPEPEPAPPTPPEPTPPPPEPEVLAERAPDAVEPEEIEPEPEEEPVEDPVPAAPAIELAEVDTEGSGAPAGGTDGPIGVTQPGSGDGSGEGDPSTDLGPPGLDLPYIQMSSQKYLSMVEYPPRAERRGIEGMGLLQVTLNRKGEVLDWNIVQPTGNPLLDREIERVARRVTQLEPLPANYPLDEASFVVPFSFLLR